MQFSPQRTKAAAGPIDQDKLILGVAPLPKKEVAALAVKMRKGLWQHFQDAVKPRTLCPEPIIARAQRAGDVVLIEDKLKILFGVGVGIPGMIMLLCQPGL